MRIRLRKAHVILVAAFCFAMTTGFFCPGLTPTAYYELHQAGVDKYVGQFTPATSEPAGDWVRHTFDPDGGNGPICIDGSAFNVYTRTRNPHKLVIFLDGGGACWQGFYFCSFTADANPPGPVGIFADSYDTGSGTIENPFDDWSIMFASYCDGSVWSGDNDVPDAVFPGGVRHHRGLRNLTAAMDLAKAEFPHLIQGLVTGSSAGGVGAAGFAPFVFRFEYGNVPELRVHNDAGPVAVNLSETAAIQARADDWQFGQFYPASCTDCDPLGQAAAIIGWRLDHDLTLKEGLYDTDGDATDRFFLNVPTQEAYRALLLSVHDPIHAAHPFTYRRFIRSGDDSHTALATPLFYVGTANGVPLYRWLDDFVNGGHAWKDIVEDFVPLP
jgi:Pectinacetylesterase